MVKYDLTEEDYDALLEYEDVRKSGIMNMWLYMGMMSKGEVSGSKELANRIPKPGFYTDFLNSLKEWKRKLKTVEMFGKKQSI